MQGLWTCPKRIVSDISKNSKMSRQLARGPLVGSKPKSTFVYYSVSTKKRQRLMGIQRGGNKTPSTNATHVVAKINEPERQMLNGKLVLVNEHGKPLEMKDEVELSDDETSRYMSSTGG
ncbi:hypothetical protein Tco_1245663 [Tanacetum coccineum]